MKISVINRGKRSRYRVGTEFRPGQRIELDVTEAALRALRATRDLEIASADPEVDEEQIQPHEISPEEEHDNSGRSDATGNVTGPHLQFTAEDGEGSEETSEEDPSGEKLDIESLTVDQVIQAVEDGRISAHNAIVQEEAGKGRKSLLEALQEMA